MGGAVRALGRSPGRGARARGHRVQLHLSRARRRRRARGRRSSGRLKHHAASRGELPAVGDWVVVRQPRRRGRAARSSPCCRGAAASRARRPARSPTSRSSPPTSTWSSSSWRSTRTSACAALERYLLLARESGATPVVLLTKPDLAADVPRGASPKWPRVAAGRAGPRAQPALQRGARRSRRRTSRPGGRRAARVVRRRQDDNHQPAGRRGHATDARRARGRFEGAPHDHASRARAAAGRRAASSTRPACASCSSGTSATAVRETFDDVEALAAGCHFTDCRHRDEPRCAVKAAVDAGQLDADAAGELPEAAGRAGASRAAAGRAGADRGEAPRQGHHQGGEQAHQVKAG